MRKTQACAEHSAPRTAPRVDQGGHRRANKVTAPLPQLALLAALLPLRASAAGRAPPAPALLGLGDVPPPWPATWQLNMSTAIMPANYNGWTRNVSKWGYVDFDWSNNKQAWAKQKPMTCEEDLLAQVRLSSADSANAGQRFYVYRNSIKALSWFASVRELLVDPAYSPWFLRFAATPPKNNGTYYSPPCDPNYNPPLCSNLYHDQTQSPAYPKGDGDCAAPACDTGAVPSGEYLWDFRQLNTSIRGVTLREWWIETWLFGEFGGGSELVSGFFFDVSVFQATFPLPIPLDPLTCFILQTPPSPSGRLDGQVRSERG